jgi:hypothetical protein
MIDKYNYMVQPAGNKDNPHYVLVEETGDHHLNDMFFDTEEHALEYAEKKGVNVVCGVADSAEEGISPGM